MTKILIVSKDEKFFMTTEDFSKLQNVQVSLIKNNTIPITHLYNKFLSDAKKQPTVDVVIFMHADVRLNINHLVKRIEECKNKYDLMFLCGTSKIFTNHSPLNWFAASNQCPQCRWGCVTHGELNNRKSFFSSHSPTVEDHEIGVGDGLCIIFGQNALKSNLMFDEALRFNCYDTQISLSALIEHKLRVGCIVEHSLQHYSIGKSILTDDFLIDEKILRERFKLDIPHNSRLEQLIKNGII